MGPQGVSASGVVCVCGLRELLNLLVKDCWLVMKRKSQDRVENSALRFNNCGAGQLRWVVGKNQGKRRSVLPFYRGIGTPGAAALLP